MKLNYFNIKEKDEVNIQADANKNNMRASKQTRYLELKNQIWHHPIYRS